MLVFIYIVLPTIFKRRRHRLIVSLRSTFLPYLVTSNVSLCRYLCVVVLIIFFFSFLFFFNKYFPTKFLMKRKLSFKIKKDSNFILGFYLLNENRNKIHPVAFACFLFFFQTYSLILYSADKLARSGIYKTILSTSFYMLIYITNAVKF